MTRNEWDLIVDTKFASRDDAADFQCWMRRYDLCPLNHSAEQVERYIREWEKSRTRGRNRSIIDKRRRKQHGPGKYWAASSAGVALNKKFVKGWRGINPENP